MNKILVGSKFEINNNIYDLEIRDEDIVLDIIGSNKIYIYNEKINNLTIEMADNSNLDIYLYNILSNKLLVNINQYNNATINFNYSFLSNNDTFLSITNNIIGSNNESNIRVRNISNNGIAEIEVTSCISSNTTNNIVNEIVNGINNGGDIIVTPLIICKSNEVKANHFTTVGSIRKDEINYLMNKSLEYEDAKKLILDGFIFNYMDLYIKEIIKK